MALSLGNTTFQVGTAFSVPIVGATAERPYVASTSGTVGSREMYINDVPVGYNLTGTFPAVGSFTVTMRDSTGSYTAAVTVQSGAVSAAVALSQTTFTPGVAFRVPLLNTTSARPYISSSAGTLSVEPARQVRAADVGGWYASGTFGVAGNQTVVLGDATTRYTNAVTVGVAPPTSALIAPIFTRTGGPLLARVIDNGDGTFSTSYNAADFKQTGTTYYVRTTGNDTTGDGSVGNPWRTAQMAATTAASGSQIDVQQAGRFGKVIVPAAKNLSFYGVLGTIFGDVLTGADITFGALASGRQTATLASGTVAGFTDLSRLQATWRGEQHPQVSLTVTTAGAIATNQASGLPGILRGTPSTVGAGDARDLTGTADTTTVFWGSAATSAITISGASVVYCSNITFIGGDIVAPSPSSFVAENCRSLGFPAHSVTGAGGKIILKDHTCRGPGSQAASIDNLHYTDARVLEIDVYTDQLSHTAASDNASTNHTGLSARVRGSYGDAARTIHDVNDMVTGIFGSKLRGSDSYDLAAGINANLGVTNMHVKAASFDLPKKLYIDTTANGIAQMYAYDASLAGATVTGGAVTDRSGGFPTSARVFVEIDPSNISTLWKDTAATIPVTADGDIVLRINNAAGVGFWTNSVGTITYRTSAGKSWLTFSGARLVPTSGMPFYEPACHIIMGVRSTDTTSILMAASTTQNIFDMRGVSSNPTQSIFVQGSGGYRVNGGADLATSALLRAAAFNGGNNVLTLHDCDLDWTKWASACLFNNFTGTTFSFEGDLVWLQIPRAIGSADLVAREAICAGKF